MAPLALTPAQRKAAKWILRRAVDLGEAATAYLISQLDEDGTPASPIKWSRWHVRWNRSTPAGFPEDRGEFKLDIVNITSGDVDATWTSTDTTDVHNILFALRTALLPFINSSQQFVENVAYMMAYNHAMDPLRPFLPTGTPIFSASSTQAGTGTGNAAYQTAGTITFKTPFTKHWGRAYLPTPGTNSLDANGRLTSSYRSGVAGAFRTAFDSLAAKDFFPVVPMVQAAKTPNHALMGIRELQVDDIPDVVRRRRPKLAAARTLA